LIKQLKSAYGDMEIDVTVEEITGTHTVTRTVGGVFGFGGRSVTEEVEETMLSVRAKLNYEIPLDFAFAMVDQVVENYPVDTNRITVSGLSTGGDGTWRALERRPDLFAAGVPLANWIAFTDKGMEEFPILKKIPVWSIYSSDDRSIDEARKEFERVEKAGANVRKTEFGICGHSAWTPAMLQADIFAWLLSRAKDGDRFYAVYDPGVDPDQMKGIVEVATRDTSAPPTLAPVVERQPDVDVLGSAFVAREVPTDSSAIEFERQTRAIEEANAAMVQARVEILGAQRDVAEVRAMATTEARARADSMSIDVLADSTILLGAAAWSLEDRERASEASRAREEAIMQALTPAQLDAFREVMRRHREKVNTRLSEVLNSMPNARGEEARVAMQARLVAVVNELNAELARVQTQAIAMDRARASAQAQAGVMQTQPVAENEEIVLMRVHSKIIAALRAADASIGLWDLREVAMAKAAELVGELTDVQKERMFVTAQARASRFVPPQRDPNEVFRTGHRPLEPGAQLVGIDSTPDGVAYYLISPDRSERTIYGRDTMPAIMQSEYPAVVRMREQRELINAYRAATNDEERAIALTRMNDASYERQRAEYGIVPPRAPRITPEQIAQWNRPLMETQVTHALPEVETRMPEQPIQISGMQPGVVQRMILPDGTVKNVFIRSVTTTTMPATPTAMPPSPERDHAYARLATKYFVMMEGLQRLVVQQQEHIAQMELHVAQQDFETYRRMHALHESAMLRQRQRLGAASVAFVDCFNKISPQIRMQLVPQLIERAENIESLRMLEALLDGVQPTMLGAPTPPRPVSPLSPDGERVRVRGGESVDSHSPHPSPLPEGEGISAPTTTISAERIIEECNRPWAMTTESLYGMFPADWDKEAEAIPDFIVNSTSDDLSKQLARSVSEDPESKDFIAACRSILLLTNKPMSSPWFETSGGRLRSEIQYSLSPKGEMFVRFLRVVADSGNNSDKARELSIVAKRTLEKIDLVLAK